MYAGYIRLITLWNEHDVTRIFIQLAISRAVHFGYRSYVYRVSAEAITFESKASFSFELLQCVHAHCHHARISCSFIHFNTFKAHPAKTRTFKSTLLVAMTHLIFPPPLSSFFTMPLANPLESPFDVGPIGTSGAHRMLFTKCP